MRNSISPTSKFSFAIACTVFLPCQAAFAAPETSGSGTSVASGVSEAAPSSSSAAKLATPNAPPQPSASPSEAATNPVPPTKVLPTPLPKSTPKPAVSDKTAPAAKALVTEPAATPKVEAVPDGPKEAPTAATAVAAIPDLAAPPSRQSPVPTQPAGGAKAVVAPPEPLPPEAPLAAYFDVGVVAQTNWNTDPAYDFFSDNDLLPKGGLVIGADVAHFGAAVFAVDVNALFTGTSSVGPLPSYISNGEISETDLGGGLTLRYGLWSWLAPQARVGGGVALQKTSLTSPDFGDLRQEFASGYLTLGGGVALTTPSQRLHRTRTYFNSLGLRIIVEGGYHLGQELEFSVKAKPINDSDAPNPIAQTPLGVLPQSGPYLRVSVHARF